MDNFIEMDLYGIIGAEPTATIKEIEKAFRKKSLTCHPDKNPNNPKATELFIQLKTALQILTDTESRAKYDRVLNAKHQAKIRTEKVDAKRQKLINDLEAREAAARNGPTLTEREKRTADINRVEKESFEQMQQELQQMMQQVKEQLSKEMNSCENKKDDENMCRVKLRWKADKNDPTNGGYDYASLHRMLSKYGEIVTLIILAEKNGRGLVQFTNKDAAELAVQIEIGLARNPLVLKGLWDSKKPGKSTATNRATKEPSEYFSFSAQSVNNDLESSVLANLRRAEERRRLMEEIRAEDERNEELG